MLHFPAMGQSATWLKPLVQSALFVMMVLACGVFIGLWLTLTFCPEELLPWLANPQFSTESKTWHGITISTSYCGIVFLLQLFTARWLLRRLRARSWKTVSVFIVLQVVASLIATYLIIQADTYLWGKQYDILKLLTLFCVSLVFSLIFNGFYYMTVVNRELRAAERTAMQAELKALRAQINPHFLFNALNSIASLIRTRPGEAEEVTEHLADLFRYSLRSSDRSSVTLGEELESVEYYLAIEATRFPDRLSVEVLVPPALRRVRVPSLLLQPLVENAIKHGLNKSEESCKITISSRREGDEVVLAVADTGPGFASINPATVFSSGTGLNNVQSRLELEFGAKAGIDIHRNRVEIRFPWYSADEASPQNSATEHALATPALAGIES